MVIVRGNTQFPVASHILALVGINKIATDTSLTSSEIASSVNTNPVVIRRILSILKTKNLVHVRPGVGGVDLLKSPKDITLLEIFKAVQSTESPSIFDLHKNVNQDCPIGSVINSVLSVRLDSAQIKMEEELSKSTLYDVMLDIANKNNYKLD